METNILKIEIPFWYKPFIRFMPKFWEKLPKEETGKFAVRVDMVPFSFVGTVYKGKESKIYTSLQEAYLKVRWKALWIDWKTALFSEDAVRWNILNR